MMLGAAVAAQADHLLIILVLRQADMENSGHLGRRPGARKHILPKQFQRRKIRLMGLGPVFESDPGLHGAVVSTDDLAQAACIAAAADVFEQERKVEAAGLVGRKLCLRGDAHAQQTAAQRVTVHRPFGQVQRVGERRDDLRQRDGSVDILRTRRKEAEV